jgi:hypothetical protein
MYPPTTWIVTITTCKGLLKVRRSAVSSTSVTHDYNWCWPQICVCVVEETLKHQGQLIPVFTCDLHSCLVADGLAQPCSPPRKLPDVPYHRQCNICRGWTLSSIRTLCSGEGRSRSSSNVGMYGSRSGDSSCCAFIFVALDPAAL